MKRERQTRERVKRENKVQRDQDKIRETARKGGYEDDYDAAVKKYAGPATKKSVEKSKPQSGAGHVGESGQPGLK